MVQAADRRQLGATSTPPSLPAPSWRRDLTEKPGKWAPPGAFGVFAGSRLSRLNYHGRPALAMVLAPVLGLLLWGALFALMF
jgi:hypothetical protein